MQDPRRGSHSDSFARMWGLPDQRVCSFGPQIAEYLGAEVSTASSLVAIASILAGGVGLSLVNPPKEE